MSPWAKTAKEIVVAFAWIALAFCALVCFRGEDILTILRSVGFIIVFATVIITFTIDMKSKEFNDRLDFMIQQQNYVIQSRPQNNNRQ